MMTELRREEVLEIAKECGIDGLNPMGFYMTDIRLEWLERFAAAIYSKGFAAGAEDWKEIVIDKLVICHILNAEHESNPVKALNDLINWHVEVALDPLVSSDAQELINRGAEDMRERADDAWAGAIQADLENGGKWLNENTAKSFRHAYPELAKLGETIRALPITPTNKGDSHG